MTLTEILEELRGQHATLRRLAEEVRAVAARPSSAVASRELAVLLRALGDAVDAHNAREEALLGDILPTLDAWGPVRAAKMDDQHRREHQRLFEAIRTAADSGEFAAAAGAARAIVEELLEHMREEEAEQLNADVLRDDAIVVDQSDG